MQNFPSDDLIFWNSIGEESYSAGYRPSLTDEPTFCVDPIGAVGLALSLTVADPSQMERLILSMGFPLCASLLGSSMSVALSWV